MKQIHGHVNNNNKEVFTKTQAIILHLTPSLNIENNTSSRKIPPTLADSNSAISLQLYFLTGDAVLLATQWETSSWTDIWIIDWRSTYSTHLDSSTYGSLAIAAKASMRSMLMQLNVTRKIHASHIFSSTHVHIWHAVQCSHQNFKTKSFLQPCLLTITVLLPGSGGKWVVLGCQPLYYITVVRGYLIIKKFRVSSIRVSSLLLRMLTIRFHLKRVKRGVLANVS